MPRYYLGVDGGGTNCRIRLADENLNTLADAAGGRSNLQIEAGEPAYRSIMEGSKEAFAKAGIDYSEAANTYACFGMAGGRLPSAREAFEKRPWPFAGVKVYDDIDIARAGAHGGEDGAVIIVGTGSAALAMVDGKRHQAGGWGFQIGDQMSGAILGRELVRRAVEADDGLVPGSELTQAVVDKLGGSIDAVMDWSFPQDPRGPLPAGNGAPSTLLGRAPAEFGALIPLFFEYYEKGDAVAKELMEIELGYIDNYVRWFKARGVTRMAAVGGFGTRLYPLMIERYGDFIVRPVSEPLHGAVILAKQNFA
ncbi:BadF/BadG/BcrA/BcrD ATPase family protein [Devosia sp. ZB163]|uniref:BadF/BadG/BcrA/BcrD ATPase family protein n=1 Tax=Devosia sp. ZB163 TaxID=3025938 RepID=UPI0023609713|nr:BadF/BadG/BcrA/BcrD ATPase family protein [Devosia sp. ZB163]MDC9823165.1 BadF/BadG/BcrA/BcrD ATPase family protein [Devosia sp. ZB163]